MNKYLEKIAEISQDVGPDATMGRVAKPSPEIDPGKRLVKGSKTLFNHSLYKAAEDLDPNNTKKDVLNTGTIAALGGVTGMAASSVSTAKPFHSMFHAAEGASKAVRLSKGAKKFGLMAGTGLLADYAGLKINDAMNKKLFSKE